MKCKNICNINAVAPPSVSKASDSCTDFPQQGYAPSVLISLWCGQWRPAGWALSLAALSTRTLLYMQCLHGQYVNAAVFCIYILIPCLFVTFFLPHVTRFSWYYSCILCGCLFSLLFNLPQLFFCTALEKHGRFPAIPVDGLWLELQLSSTKCGSNPIHNWTDFGREQPCFSSPGQPLSDTLYMNVAVGKYFLQPAIHVQSSDGAISEAESAPSTMGVGCNIQLRPCCKGQDKKKN